MLAATAVLENGWKPNMTEEAAKKLCRDAIAAGIINDMGSGSNVDLAIIKPNDHCEVRVICCKIRLRFLNIISSGKFKCTLISTIF